jgi:hypothetical protein
MPPAELKTKRKRNSAVRGKASKKPKRGSSGRTPGPSKVAGASGASGAAGAAGVAGAAGGAGGAGAAGVGPGVQLPAAVAGGLQGSHEFAETLTKHLLARNSRLETQNSKRSDQMFELAKLAICKAPQTASKDALVTGLEKARCSVEDYVAVYDTKEALMAGLALGGNLDQGEIVAITSAWLTKTEEKKESMLIVEAFTKKRG